MARINFPAGFEGAEHLPRTRRNLQNCFNNGSNRILSRPGIVELNTTGGVARGNFVWNGGLYQVVSEELIKITNLQTGEFKSIGTISGSEPVETDFGFNETVIVVKGGKIYTLDRDDVLIDISTQPNLVPSVDVAHINGRFVTIPADGSPAFFSDVGNAGSVQTDSFFDAEELPDLNNAVFNGKNTLYICGTDSIELFRNTDSHLVFTRISGSRILNGYIGGLLEYTNTFLFIGREKDQDRGIYSIVPGGAAKISNEAIDLILSGYTDNELAAAISGRVKWRGYDLATFTLNRDSFGFWGGHWFILDTLFNGVSRPWGGGFIAQFEGDYFTAFNDKIGRFDNVNTDYSERVTKIIDTGFEQEDGDFFSCQSIELGLSQGFNSAASSVALRMSRDNVQYGPPVYMTTGNIGEYQKKLSWNLPGGLGSFDGFMGVRFYTTEDVEFSADYMVANIR